MVAEKSAEVVVAGEKKMRRTEFSNDKDNLKCLINTEQ
jgi:hypothetical protein